MPFIGNQPALSYTSFVKQDFTTSATTSYTLDNPVTNENELALFINFVRQEPTTAYTASGTSLTLTSATSATDDMYCVYLGKAVQTVNPPNGSVGTSQLADSSVSLAKLSATGTPSSSTFLRGDNSWQSAGGVNTPYFEATLSSSTGYLTNNTYTKVQCDSEIHDSAGNYDNSTNYRFTPTTAGKYFIYANVTGDANGDGRLRNMYCAIYRNGSRIKESRINLANNHGRNVCMTICGIFTMNGSSDYIELYGAVDDSSGTSQGYLVGGEHKCLFGGYKIIE